MRAPGLALVAGLALLVTPAQARFTDALTPLTLADPCEANYTFDPPAGLPPDNGSLPNGSVGHPYNQQIKVAGNLPPYLWQLTSVLPPGISWSTTSSPGTTANDIAVLSGTPTDEWQPGAPSVGLAVHDNQGTGGTSCATGRYWNIVIGLAPHNTVKPVITGVPNVGSTLSCNNGSWTGTATITFTKQWIRNDVTVVGSGDDYQVQPADAAGTLKCVVTGHNDFPPDEAAGSDPVTVANAADLGVNVFGTPPEIVEGDNVTYTITVSNDGPQEAADVELSITDGDQTSRVSTTPSQGSCSSEVKCELGTLAPGASATVTAVVRATVASNARTLREEASVTSSTVDPGPNANNDFAETRVIVRGPKLQVSPSTLDFGLVPTEGGPELSKQVTLLNVGNANLTLTACHVTAASGGFEFRPVVNGSSWCDGQNSALNIVVAPGLSHVMDVYPDLNDEGIRSGTLQIESDGGTGTVELLATGGDPHLEASPKELDFGTWVVSKREHRVFSSPLTVTLTNTGTLPLHATSAYVYGLAPIDTFRIVASPLPCIALLAPGGVCKESVVFSPTKEGPLEDSITIGSDAGPKADTVKLKGVGARLAVGTEKPGNGFTDISIGVAGPGVVVLEQSGNATGSRAHAARGVPHVIAPTRKRARKAGIVTLRVRPTAAGKKLLARRHSIAVPVKVTFKPASGKKATTRYKLTLRRR